MLYHPNPHSEPEVRRCSGQPLPDMVVVLGLWYPRAQLALWAVRAHCWLAFNLQLGRTPRSLSVGLIFSVLVLSLYMLRAAPSQVQNPALALVKLHAVGDCPALCFVKISLQGISALERVNSSSSLVLSSDLVYTQVLHPDTISRPSLSLTD